MFSKREVEQIVESMRLRKASLYHACQYRDFVSYVELGGVPSRSLLEQKGLGYTSFDTDRSDKEKGLDGLVFANFSDFGFTFERGNAGVPNPYGPILLEIDPEALLLANEIAICLRSAGAVDFDRRSEALTSFEDFQKIWADDPQFPNSRLIKTSVKLTLDFVKSYKINQPELSCDYSDQLIPWDFVSWVKVDPYRISGMPLKQIVQRENNPYSTARFIERKGSQVESYQELQNLVSSGIRTLDGLRSSTEPSSQLGVWARKISPTLDYQFKRFADYLEGGTLRVLRDKIAAS